MVATTLPAVVRVIDLPTGTTVTGAELIEAVQTSGGVGQSVQLSLNQIVTSLGIPAGGATGTILNKSSGSNYSTQFSAINTFVNVGTSLATTGVATSIVAFVPNQGITSTQILNNAVGTNQIASSLGIASTLSIGGALTVTGTATFNGTTIHNATTAFNNGIQVTGTSLFTGTFGVVGTSQFTGGFNVVGTSVITGSFGQIGTSLMTGQFGITGTSLMTGALTVVGTAIFTGGFNFSVLGTTSITGVFGQVGTSLMTGQFGVVGTATFTSGAFNVVGTSVITGSLSVSGTASLAGTFVVSAFTSGMVVASSTGVVSATTNIPAFGFTITAFNNGTIATGSVVTCNPLSGNYQFLVNNGNFTFGAYSTADHALDCLVTNSTNAGTITFTGFTVNTSNVGDALSTTSTNKFIIMSRRINAVSTYVIKALQ